MDFFSPFTPVVYFGPVCRFTLLLCKKDENNIVGKFLNQASFFLSFLSSLFLSEFEFGEHAP